MSIAAAMTECIDKFSGEHRFLSNFWMAPVEYEGIEYPSSEHAYQAAKTTDVDERRKIAALSHPTHAKKAGRALSLRPDWKQVKVFVMEEILRLKFASLELAMKLAATGNAELAEGNTWGDTFWGVCGGAGQNHLGRLLMKIREEISSNKNTLFEKKNIKIVVGDCREVLATLQDACVDAVVTDPPYHLTQLSRGGSPRNNDIKTPFGRTRLGERGFMNKTWDGGDIAQSVELWREVLRVLKPGGHLLAFGATRTYHRMMCAIEDAGLEIRDSLHWIYGCLSEDTEILVDGKWSTYHKAIADRHALTYNKDTDELSWQPIQELYVYNYSDTAFRIYSDRTDQIVTRGHRCLVERDGAYSFQVAETLQREARVPVLEGLPGLLDLQAKFAVESSSIRDESRSQTVRASRFASADLAIVEPITYNGIVWCVRVPSGAFVARRNGKVFITGNSGFPKSLDVSKAIDAAGGSSTEEQARDSAPHLGVIRAGSQTPLAARWVGWGTALKPAHEPIVLARKPLIGTVAANIQAHGTGALNIDACRIATENNLNGGAYAKNGSARHDGAENWRYKRDGGAGEYVQPVGRWPANVLFDEEAAAELDAQSGYLTSGVATKTYEPTLEVSHSLGTKKRNLSPEKTYGGGGGASRFFYVAKASRSEREQGCSDLPLKSAGEATDREDGSAGLNSPRAGAGRTTGARNYHPTVKPIALMRYLIRLITPPGGVVLDPFAGSGSTGCAAALEGFDCLMIEMDESYAKIARARVAHWAAQSNYQLTTKGRTGARTNANTNATKNESSKEILMGQDVAAEVAGQIAGARVFGSSDNIRHGKYKFLIKRIFAELVETDAGKHKMGFWELTPLTAEANPQVEGDHVDYPGAAGPLKDDGTHPNVVGSNCALKVDFDGPGARSAGANLKAPILALFNKRDGEISEPEVNNTWVDLARQKDLRIGDAIGIDPTTQQPILSQKAKIANPACGMVIGCSTVAKKKRTPNDKGAYVTKLAWFCVAPIGTGENSNELVAKRRAEILAAADDGEEETVAGGGLVAPVNGGGSSQAPQMVPAPPAPPMSPTPPPVLAKPWLIGWLSHPQAPGYWYNPANVALGCFTEAQLAAGAGK